MGVLPNAEDPLNREFWEGLVEGRLLIQRCQRCGYLRWPPSPVCPECQSTENAWRPVRPKGTLWSYATYHRALDAAFADQVPYTVALVELLEGPRMYGRLLNADAGIKPGIAVRAIFNEIAPGRRYVAWEPISSGQYQ